MCSSDLSEARFDGPAGLAIDANGVLVADSVQCSEGISFFHVRRVLIAHNMLEGDFGAVLAGAKDLEVLDASHNRLTGELFSGGALTALIESGNLRELHVARNALTDTADRPVVHAALSQIASLRAYDISGNNFVVAAARTRGSSASVSGPTAVHAALHLDVNTRHLCQNAPGEHIGSTAYCGRLVRDAAGAEAEGDRGADRPARHAERRADAGR